MHQLLQLSVIRTHPLRFLRLRRHVFGRVHRFRLCAWRNTPPRGLDALEAVDLLEQLRDPLLSLPACLRVGASSHRRIPIVLVLVAALLLITLLRPLPVRPILVINAFRDLGGTHDSFAPVSVVFFVQLALQVHAVLLNQTFKFAAHPLLSIVRMHGIKHGPLISCRHLPVPLCVPGSLGLPDSLGDGAIFVQLVLPILHVFQLLPPILSSCSEGALKRRNPVASSCLEILLPCVGILGFRRVLILGELCSRLLLPLNLLTGPILTGRRRHPPRLGRRRLPRHIPAPSQRTNNRRRKGALGGRCKVQLAMVKRLGVKVCQGAASMLQAGSRRCSMREP
mmetsp:Transcript_34769/g.82423  ORF Transcript_34769/g.82423 Transcript_34769/m.82423 type:complete len:338 (-) Transcript_34769:83-1096(-)